MESVVEDAQGAGQEADGSQRNGTSTERGPSHETTMDSGLLSTGEKLSNEVVNTGTRATTAPCQLSHDGSSSDDTAQGIPHDTFTGDLEASPAALETATEERHAGSEMRPLKEEKECLKEPETSSDDTDDWETASERSLALDLEPHDPHKARIETNSQERDNEDAGLHGSKTISEDAGAYGQETLSDSTGQESIPEKAETHGQETLRDNTGQEGIPEKAGPHGQETLSDNTGQEGIPEKAGPHGQETLSDNTGQEGIPEEAGPHGQETLRDNTGQDGIPEEAGPHDQETLSDNTGQEGIPEEAGPRGHEMLREDAGPHSQETVSEDDESDGRDEVCENAWTRGQETVDKIAEGHSHEIASEDSERHSHEMVRTDAWPHGQETVNEVDERHGLERVSEKSVPFGSEMLVKEADAFGHDDFETDNREASLHSLDTSDVTGSYGQETVNKEEDAEGQEVVDEETAPYSKEKTETVTDLTNRDGETDDELVGPLDNETASDVTWPHGSDAVLWGNETVSGVESEEFDEDCKRRPISVVLDQMANENIVTVSEETSEDEETSDSEENLSPDENKEIESEEILETSREEIKSDSTYDEGVSKGTFGDGTDGSHFKTQDVYKETFQEDTQVVYMEREDNEEKQKVYKGMDNHEMQGIYKQTVGENTLQETPDSEDTEVIDAGMVETSSKRMEKVQNEERTVNEPSNEERERTTKVQMKPNEGGEHNDVFSEDPRVLDEDAIDDKQRWDLVEAISKCELTEDFEITDLECERLTEELHSLNALVGSGEGLPSIMSQATVLEMQLRTPVTTDDSSGTDCTMNLEANMDVSGPPLTEEEGQVDYAETWSNIETKCIDIEDGRYTDSQNEPSNTLGLISYNVVPEVQVVSSDGQEIGGPCLQLSGLHTEQDSRSNDDSSIAVEHQGLDDPKPLLEETIMVEMLDPHHGPLGSQMDQEQSTQEVSGDEPDHHKLEFFPITLKGPSIVVSALDFLPESIDTECIASQEATQSTVKESGHQESTLGDTDPTTGFHQDLMTSVSDTAKTTTKNSTNITFFRQRSNTDPGLIQVQDEKLQASSDAGGSFKARVRSKTPPCDKVTSSYASTPPKTLEPFTSPLLYPMMDEDKNSPKGKDTPVKAYTFYPTQIFNPLLLLGHAEEESGFYQAETFGHSSMENASQRPLPSPPQDTRVLRHTQKPEIIVVEPKTSPSSTVDASNTRPMLAPSVAPVWLPPQRTRYTVDPSGANEIRTMRTAENSLMRRATIRHRRSNVGANPTPRRMGNPNLPPIPQQDYVAGPTSSNLPRIQPVNVNTIQISARNRPLPPRPVSSEETGQSRSLSSMESVREEGQPAARERPTYGPESVLLRGTRREMKPPPSDPSHSIPRRYSTLINSSNLLYQEYSDVALNQEIQRQKPGSSPAEDSQPGSPRVRRRALSSQDSYLQRLSVSSADSLWQDIPKIRDSVTFLTMTREEQKLQEAKFELIMSEALYLRSLNIAVDHFQRSEELMEVLTAQDRQWLFSRLSEVRDASSDFLFDLEEEFESNMYKFQVCDVLILHEPTFRRVYLPYVTNQSYQDRTFQRLMNGNPRFQQVLSRLESDAVCQRLSLKSFLILPFQRITRLRLLLQNILKRSAPGSAEELQATGAHNAVEKLIRDCNESVQRMKDTEELILLNQKIQFECKIFPLISQSRRLVKHGEVTTLEFSSTSFKAKITTRPVYLHLFNDCLLLSRVREGGRFVVFDHASEVRVEGCEVKLHNNQKNIFRIFLRDSAATGRETEYILRTETQSQKLRWICALSSTKEKIDFWRDHGLSQMQCIKSYKARENDELSLEKADILMITQNSDDGWLHGVRLSDQQSGWFPQSHVQNISRNACLRNLQEEQRLQNARAKLQPAGPQGH